MNCRKILATKRTSTEQSTANIERHRRKMQRVHKTEHVDDLAITAEYFVEKDLLKVKPYFHEYQAYVKGRWVDRTILDVFTSEFKDKSAKYYVWSNGK